MTSQSFSLISIQLLCPIKCNAQRNLINNLLNAGVRIFSKNVAANYKPYAPGKPNVLDAAVRTFVALATWHLVFVHHWLNK
jgi:hypothetical protein